MQEVIGSTPICSTSPFQKTRALRRERGLFVFPAKVQEAQKEGDMNHKVSSVVRRLRKTPPNPFLNAIHGGSRSPFGHFR